MTAECEYMMNVCIDTIPVVVFEVFDLRKVGFTSDDSVNIMHLFFF